MQNAPHRLCKDKVYSVLIERHLRTEEFSSQNYPLRTRLLYLREVSGGNDRADSLACSSHMLRMTVGWYNLRSQFNKSV